MQHAIRDQSPRAAALICHPSARGRGRPARHPGTARPRATVHDAAIHPYQRGTVARGLSQGPPAGQRDGLVTHVAFLRAINVGGRAVVKMSALKMAFERAGYPNVRTFIASGNVLFEAPAKLPATLRAAINRDLVRLFGTMPGVCYRTLD